MNRIPDSLLSNIEHSAKMVIEGILAPRIGSARDVLKLVTALRESYATIDEAPGVSKYENLTPKRQQEVDAAFKEADELFMEADSFFTRFGGRMSKIYTTVKRTNYVQKRSKR